MDVVCCVWCMVYGVWCVLWCVWYVQRDKGTCDSRTISVTPPGRLSAEVTCTTMMVTHMSCHVSTECRSCIHYIMVDTSAIAQARCTSSAHLNCHPHELSRGQRRVARLPCSGGAIAFRQGGSEHVSQRSACWTPCYYMISAGIEYGEY
jgi:hypothetical protein